MPEYTYKCKACETVYEKRHSIKERLVDCEKCNVSGSLERIPSVPLILKNNTRGGIIEKPGTMVNRHIADAREELEREKKDLSEKEY